MGRQLFLQGVKAGVVCRHGTRKEPEEAFRKAGLFDKLVNDPNCFKIIQNAQTMQVSFNLQDRTYVWCHIPWPGFPLRLLSLIKFHSDMHLKLPVLP